MTAGGACDKARRERQRVTALSAADDRQAGGTDYRVLSQGRMAGLTVRQADRLLEVLGQARVHKPDSWQAVRHSRWLVISQMRIRRRRGRYTACGARATEAKSRRASPRFDRWPVASTPYPYAYYSNNLSKPSLCKSCTQLHMPLTGDDCWGAPRSQAHGLPRQLLDDRLSVGLVRAHHGCC